MHAASHPKSAPADCILGNFAQTEAVNPRRAGRHRRRRRDRDAGTRAHEPTLRNRTMPDGMEWSRLEARVASSRPRSRPPIPARKEKGMKLGTKLALGVVVLASSVATAGAQVMEKRTLTL